MSGARHRGRIPSLVVVILAAIACLGGLIAPHIYRDEPLIRDGFIVNDAVTLLLALPLMVVVRRKALAGSTRARLLWIGTLHYVLYNYGFYLFGAVLNEFLLLYAAVVSLSVWSLGLAVADVKLPTLPAFFRDSPARRVAAWMAFMTVGLTATWTAQWLVALLRTTPPGRFDVTPEFIRVVAGMDLTLMVGLLGPGAWLLWRRDPLGLLLGVGMNVSGALYNVVLAAGTVMQIRAGLAGAWPMFASWVFLASGCLVAAAALLARARPLPEGS